MTEQNVIARKRENYGSYYSAIVVLAICAVFMAVMYFFDDEPDAYIYLIVAACFLVLYVFPLTALIREKRVPEVLIYVENGLVCFYNGFSCKPEDIRDIKSAYDGSNGVTLNSGKLTVYTDGSKIVCRRIKDLPAASAALITLKYGRVYTTDELKAALARRSAARGFIR